MPPKAFFKGQCFALSGKFTQTQKAYEELIKKHGGEVSSTVSASVNFLVSTDDDVKANTQKVALAKGRGTPIVREGFIGCCVAQKKLLDHSAFLIKAGAGGGKKRKAAAKGEAAKPAPAAKRAKADVVVGKPVTTVDSPVIAKSGLAGKAAVVQEDVSKGFVKGSLTWDVELILNDPAKGTDKYYNMQLLANTESGEFWAAQHWGKTGLDGRVHVDGPFADINAAKKVFRRKYRQKTGNVWGQLGATFVEEPGKYRLVAKEAGGAADSADKTKGRWQYYMHNSVDGKAVRWYDYPEAAAANMEKYWWQFADHPDLKLGVRVVHTDYFAYEINFNELWQTNVKTGTRRVIRRFVEGEVPLDEPPHKIPEPAKPGSLPAMKDEPSDDEDAEPEEEGEEDEEEEEEEDADGDEEEGAEEDAEGECEDEPAVKEEEGPASEAETIPADDALVAGTLPLGR